MESESFGAVGTKVLLVGPGPLHVCLVPAGETCSHITGPRAGETRSYGTTFGAGGIQSVPLLLQGIVL